MITRKSLPRRTFLRGMGTAVALPFLDAMVPAFAAPAAGKAPVRMAFVYVPNGIDMRNWNPDYEGKLRRAAAHPQAAGAVQGRHPAARQPDPQHRPRAARWRGRSRPLLRQLPHRHPGQEEHHRYQGRRFDGPDRRQQGRQRRRAFLRSKSAWKTRRQAGDCDSGYSCAYTNNLAWRSETQPLPPILDPRALFERLFGNGVVLSPEARAREAQVPPQHSGFRHRRHQEARIRPRPHRSPQARRVSLLDPRSRTADREGREGQRADRSAHGEALRRAGRFRRAFQADDRHDDDRVPGRPDARHDVPGHARRHLARLPRDRHPRRPPSADPPPQSGRPDGEGGADQRATT